MDFAAITAAINVTTIVTAIGAIAALKILPGFTKWGYAKVTSMFGR